MKNKNLRLVFTCFLVILSGMAAFPAIGQNQQEKKIQIKGIITDEKDEPMIGVVIRTKDSSTGTISDMNGAYVIDVPDRTVLIFSLLGYLPREEEVNGQKNINVKMVPAENQFSEVVVTALGIKKEKKKLAYAVQDVTSENLSKIPVPNLASNLTGRIAGMKVSNSTNLFDQPQILLRGVAPKIVVDGVPVESATFFEISPEDIESMNVLKGPAAAVLYGQMGQNGVIQITTKKAKEASKISVNSATTFDVGLIAKPSYQTKYGTGYQGKYEAGNTTDEFWGAWGPELDGRLLPQWNSPRDENGNRIPIPWIARGANNLENMMETGFTTSNNVSFETKSDKGDFRASFSQMHQKGVFENTKLNSFTLNLSGGAQLTSKLRFDATINYNKLNSPNYPSLGYGRNSPIYTVILWTGTNVDVRDLKNYWVPGMEGLQQRNFDIGPGYDNGSYDYNNPFFVLNENLKGYYKDMVFGSTSLKYDVNKEWNVTLRTALNVNSLQQDQKIAYSTVGQRRGNYSQTFNNDFQSISDLIVKYSKRFGDFGLDAMGGGNMRIYNDRYTSASTDGLSVPGIYTLGNTITPKASTSQKRELAELALYSYFDLSWKNYVYLNATVRNQWSSTIPSTGQNSYLYPSVQLSTLVNEYIPMPDFINFFKLRGSLASVGSAFSPYKFSPVLTQGQSWNNNISMTTPSSLFDRNIKPSFSTGYEVGAEIRLLQNRLAFDAAYFYFVDGPQTYDQPISKGSGWTTVVMNGRKDLRKGWELTVSGSPIQNPKGFSWDAMFNISSYQKYLHELPEGQTQVGYIKVGERLDAIYGSAMMYAPEGSKYAGQMIIGSNGNVQKDNISQLLGYANNNFLLGFSNTFKYKNWGLNFLLDACVGGKIRSQYERYMYAGGKSLGISDVDRENWYDGKKYVAQGVMVTSGKLERDGNGNVISDTREFAPNTIETNYFDYIQQYKGYYGIDEACLVDRSYMKLRELVLTYNFPKFGKNSIIKNANISLVGRNLFLITASGLMDPDQFPESSTWDNLQTPSFRNIGVNFNLSF